MRSLLRVCALTWTLGLCLSAGAQGYIGANALLEQVQQRNSKPRAAATNEQSKLRDDLQAFGQNAASLAPADAAKDWLALVDRAIKIQREQVQSFDQSGSSVPVAGADLLAALPPPAAWNDLAQDVAARPPASRGGEMDEAGLRLLAAVLTGNVGKRNQEITNLQAKANETDSQASFFYRQALQQLGQAMLTASVDPNVILNSLKWQLNSASVGNMIPLQVPNLVSQVGAAKAEAFLREALVAPNVILQFQEPNATSQLAQALALQLMDQLKSPQWGLVNSLDAVELYEAMDKRFGNPANNPVSLPGLPPGFNMPPTGYDESQKEVAQVYYMLGLISRGRTQDAVTIAKKFKTTMTFQFGSAFDAMDRAGYAEQVDDFLNQLLSQDPTLPFWTEYVQFAAKAGQTDRMVALVRTTLQRQDLSDEKKSTLHQILFVALLAADDVDQGVQEMRQLIATNDYSLDSMESYNSGQLGTTLARIGVLMNKPEWTEEGVATAKKWLANAQGQQDWQMGEIVASLTETLEEANRGPEAESILADALAKVTRQGNSDMNAEWNAESPSRQILSSLARLYFNAGRYDDVLALLQNSSDWGVKDLSEFFTQDSWGDDQFSLLSLHNNSSLLPVPFIAARALEAKGRTEEAMRITDALLNNEPALDRGYELLILIKGTNALPQLDKLFSADQFQTRPLIWKAYLLQQEGKLEEAEKTARQAIAIDPSDGEQGRGDRMRAYAELADIREALGDKKEVDFYRGVVKAIRISEDADQYYEVGLLKRAISMYQEGLDHFSDAYCIQSRMAIQLAALGKISEAEEHYRRAYELMPDSFGRVESHCFGCERVFAGEQAQSTAEKVFTRLVAERPNKPQVHYLLGYLYTEENRFDAAWTNFQAAVRLDPDYLNAWVKMQETSQQILVSPAQRDEIAFNILRLDPLERHSSPDFETVQDLSGLWKVVAVAAQLKPKPASDLFPLAASKIFLEKNTDSSNERRMAVRMMEAENRNGGLTPARAIAQTPFVAVAGQMILNGGSSYASFISE